jgi:hypothetical protein
MNVVSKWKEIAATLGLTAGLVAVGHETYEHFYTREEAESEHRCGSKTTELIAMTVKLQDLKETCKQMEP